MSVTTTCCATPRGTPTASTRATPRSCRPRRAVVACMDARCIPTRVLGLEEGDAHVIRNAGGDVTEDTIRPLAISQRLLGTEEIILIHHTDCGMLTFTDDEFKRSMQEDVGISPRGRPRRSPTSTRTSASRSPGSRRARSSRARRRPRLRLRGRERRSSTEARPPTGRPSSGRSRVAVTDLAAVGGGDACRGRPSRRGPRPRRLAAILDRQLAREHRDQSRGSARPPATPGRPGR